MLQPASGARRQPPICFPSPAKRAGPVRSPGRARGRRLRQNHPETTRPRGSAKHRYAPEGAKTRACARCRRTGLRRLDAMPSDASRRIIVTGAAGFIGYHVAERLLRDGWTVAGVDNLNSYYDVGLKEARLARLRPSPRFDFAKLDLEDGPTR